jgi:tetratricopeptide (TPR) repeat protein
MSGTIESVLVRADQLAAQGRPHSAIAVLVPVLQEFPEYPAAWCRLAAAHLDAGDPGESLAAAKRAIVLGERSWAHRLASLALVELGRHDEAAVSAREAVRRDAADWRCHVALAEALAHDTPLDAVRSARTAVALAPDQARPHEVLGDTATFAHDWLAAEAAYLEARRLDPDNEDVVAKLARLARRPARDPRRRSPARETRRRGRRFGRVERVALLLLVRRVGVWQSVGALALMLAGQQSPSRMLAWFGLGAVVFVALLAWRGWLGLPPSARVPVGELSTLVVVSSGLAAVSALAMVGWIVLLVLGSGSLTALTLALGSGAVAAANSWFGLWRIWAGNG